MPRIRLATSTTQSSQWTALKPVESTAQPANLRLSGSRHQTFQGFGGCFNELGWIALQKATPEARTQVFRKLFHADDGLDLVMNRLPIGASDYAAEWYSCNEHDGDYAMERFSVERDERFLIPYIKEALRLQPGMMLFASPWSPPTWMKHPRAYNYGRLVKEPRNLRAYALYFVRFIEEYAKRGISIKQLHVQNEPAADQKFPSCLWDGWEMRDFIRDHLAPAFAERKIPAEIWVGTLNTDLFHAWAETILADPACRTAVKGFGYQWAGKNAVQRHAESYPEVPFAQTENECGDGQNSWSYAFYVLDLIHQYLVNGASYYTYWNMVLQPQGRSTWGWQQNSLVTIDDAGSVALTPEWWIFRHCTQAIRPGSVRLGLQGGLAATSLAFANPDGSTGVVVGNQIDSIRTLVLDTGSGTIAYELPANSVNTLVLG